MPSVLRAIAARDGLAGAELPTLGRLLWCGEALPTPTLRYWMQHLPHVRFTNLYGPTEATIASSYFTVDECPADDDDTPVPIGLPCDGEGLVHFLGRADRQIKSRGYRIELDEIAGALARLSGLRHSAVVVVESEGFEGTMICAAYVVEPGVETNPARLRTALAEALPTYMLPTKWLEADEIPATANKRRTGARSVERSS